MSAQRFNIRIRQIVMIFLICLLSFLIISELFSLLPGFLGAVTFYILGREYYLKLTEGKKWRKGLTAVMFMLIFLLLIGFPVYYAISLVTPKITQVFGNSQELMNGLQSFSDKIEGYTGQRLLSDEN